MEIQKLSRPLAVMGALALLFAIAPRSIDGQSDVGTLHVAIHDNRQAGK